MTQLPHDRAVGTDGSPAPAALSIADILQALAFGARLSMQTGDSEPTGESSGSIPPPVSPSQPSSTGQAPSPVHQPNGAVPAADSSSAAPAPVASGSAAAVAAGGGGGIVGPTLACGDVVGGNGTLAGMAKAAADNGPCAECATRGCLPPPTPDEDEAEAPVIDESTARWYIVTAGRRVGVFAHWANTTPLVVGVPGAVYARCATRAMAEAAFAAAVEANSVRVIG